MKLIVGLGNPGKKYARTRHNIGFMCLDAFAHKHSLSFSYDKKFIGEVARFEDTLLLKPTTYMNLSGNAVAPMVDYYDIATEDILVIYDDVDLPTAKLRLRYQGGSGGHKGIQSLIAALGSENFKRIKFGISKPDSKETKDYVLSRFNKSEGDDVIAAIDRANAAMREFVDDVPFSNIMNTYNQE
ncbi:MAG: aminoacyl-tRNA hydrolase [Bacillota bacterium]